MKLSTLLCAAIGVLSLHCLTAHAEREESNLQTSGASTLTADEAVKLALEYTGFGELDGFTEDQISTPNLITTEHNTTSPITVSQVKGRPVWEVVFTGILLNLPNSVRRGIQKKPKDIAVLIDAETGRLFKIYYDYDAAKHGFMVDPWYRLGGRHHYGDTELTHQPPPSTLCDALRLRLSFDPFIVKEFEAYCIEFHWPEPEKRPALKPRESVPVWLIVTRDFESVQSSDDPESPPRIQGEYIESLLIDVSTDEPRLVIRSEPAKPKH